MPFPSVPSRKRSRGIHAALFGATAFVTGCDAPVDLTFFDSVESCQVEARTSSEFTAADCDEAFEQARAEHAQLAPRYETLALCEEVHGRDDCAPSEAAGVAPPVGDETAAAESEARAHQSSFSPFLAGYMIGHLANRGFGGSTAPLSNMGRPLYRETGGGIATSDGRATGFRQPGQTIVGGVDALRTPAATARTTAVMTKATVSTRGGFGAARVGSTGG